MSTMIATKRVFPIGYSTPGSQERIDSLMSDPSTLLIDTRKVPYSSWSKEYRKEELEKKYNKKGCEKRYRWAGEYLGNEGYKDGYIKIIDPKAGIKGLITYLGEGHDLILLCQCRDYAKCHMSEIVNLLHQKMPDVVVERFKSQHPANTIPCLSIKQPWAWLIANGWKNIENRDWSTDYRGPLLIHAGKVVDKDCFTGDQINFDFFEQFEGENAQTIGPIPYAGKLKLFDVPRSVIVQNGSQSQPGDQEKALEVETEQLDTKIAEPPVEASAAIQSHCVFCGEFGTLVSPSGRPEGIYCEQHGYCKRCGGSIEQFVKYPYGDFYVCTCVAAFSVQMQHKEDMKQAKPVAFGF